MGVCLPWQGTDVALKELRSELQNFGSGPPAKLTEGKSTAQFCTTLWRDLTYFRLF